jgi:hypothetical protein
MLAIKDIGTKTARFGGPLAVRLKETAADCSRCDLSEEPADRVLKDGVAIDFGDGFGKWN